MLDGHESCSYAGDSIGFVGEDSGLGDEDGGGEIDEESEAEGGVEAGAGATLGVGRDRGIEGVFVRHSKDLAFQSIKGFSLSRKGIPRIMDCTPMGATKKVSCRVTSAIEYENVTIPEHDKAVAPSAKVTRGPWQGVTGIDKTEQSVSLMRLIDAPQSISAFKTRDKEETDNAGVETDT